MGRIGLVLAVALGATVACGHADRGPGGGTTDGAEIVALINERRAAAGCPAVDAESHLAAATDRHARDMRDHGVRDHTGSDGSSPQERIDGAGYPQATATGEILYWNSGPAEASDAVSGWMGSTPHRQVIEDCRLEEIGVAVLHAGGECIAVADFGTR